MSTVASELRGVEFPRRDAQQHQRGSFWSALALTGAVLSEMSFLDHLEELRRRLIKSVIAVAVGVVVSTAYAPAIIQRER